MGLTKGGTGVTFSVADQDNSSDNEIQQLSLVGRGLSLSKMEGQLTFLLMTMRTRVMKFST
ncbi:MAG: hypothetical protein H6561_02380 [Lewinellaceae bacterium]|nr:hypothetical protein [Lewinellaceae bacterium]